jgi:hypothetical protein
MMSHADLLKERKHAAWARTLIGGIASVACLIQCYGFIGGLPPHPGAALQVLDLLGGPFGIQLWAAGFGLAGLAGLVCVVRGCRANWLVLIMGAMWGFWGFVYLGAWFAGEQPRGYVTATWFLLIDVLLSTLLLLPARRDLRHE